MTTQSDPRELLRRSMDQAGELIATVPPGAMELATPCSSFDVRALVGHMVFGARRIGEAGRRDQITTGDPVVRGVADEEWAAAFKEAATAANETWARDGSMEGPVELPFGTFPAEVVVWMYVMEHVAHAWDLARATGSTMELDAGLAEAALAAATQMVTPEIRGGEDLPFGLEVAVPAGAPAVDRLAGYLGRRVDLAGEAERADLLAELAGVRGFVRQTVRDLRDEQAATPSTTSELCLGGIIKHLTQVERRWTAFMVEGPAGFPTPGDPAAMAARNRAFSMTADESLASVLTAYDAVAARTDHLISTLCDLGSSQPLPPMPWFEPGARWSLRAVALHLIAETAQHAGHADIIRESIDGAKTMG